MKENGKENENVKEKKKDRENVNVKGKGIVIERGIAKEIEMIRIKIGSKKVEVEIGIIEQEDQHHHQRNEIKDVIKI